MQVVYEMPFERHVERTREYQFSVSFDSTIRTSRALEGISSELENWAPGSVEGILWTILSKSFPAFAARVAIEKGEIP